MIKIYDSSGVLIEGLQNYQNLLVEEEVSQLNVLSFEIPKELGDIIEHEGYVEVKDNGRYVIKEKNLKKETYEIVAQYDLEDLREYIEAKAYVSMTLNNMMSDLLSGTGWTFQTSDSRVRTATGVTIDKLDLIYAIVRDRFGLEIKFDNQLNIITAEAEIGADRGVYFHDEVNLDEILSDSDTYDFATRIIPRGQDGLSIESINGGLPYLENLSYSNKIITVFWSDERYTVLEELKAAAQRKLDVLSQPFRSYSAKVVDLSKISGMEILSYEPGDSITLISRDSGIREKQRIVIRKKYLDEPERDSATIANRMRQVEDSNQSEFDGMKQDFTVIRANLQLLDGKILARVTKNEYDADQEAMGLAYAQLELDIDGLEVEVLNLDGDLGNLALSAEELRARLQNAEGDIGALELTATNFEVSLGNVEDSIQNIELTPGPQGPQGAQGVQGVPGAQGISITKIDVWYYLSTSATSLAGGTWTTTAPTWINERFMWSKAITTYSTGATTESTAACITGAQGTTGSTGATGTGITSITEEFYLSTSKTTQMGGSWVTTPPTWSIDNYIWTRSKIIYNNPTSTAYTVPIVSSEWEAVNGLIPRFVSNETAISTNATAIALRALKTEVEGPIYKQTTAPAHVNGRLWLNTSVTPNQLKRSNGSAWINVTPTSGAEIGLSNSQIAQIVESTSEVLAKKSEITQLDDKLLARFSEIGGSNLIRKTSKYEKGMLVGIYATLLEQLTPLSELGLQPGDYVTFRVYIKAPYSIGAMARINLEYNLNGLDYTAVTGNHILGQTEGYSTVTVQIPTGCVAITLYIQNGTVGYEANIFYKEPKLEKNRVATAWTPHVEELYTGITEITKDGISVGVSSSSTNTKIAYDGLRVYDGVTEQAYFGESGSYIPELQVNRIYGADVLSTITGGVTLSVGPGYQYPTITAALNSLNSGNRKARYILDNGTIEINVYGTTIDHVVLDGWIGGAIQVNFMNGAKILGSFNILNCLTKITLVGISGKGLISRYNQAFLITVTHSHNVSVTDINFDYGGASGGRGLNITSSRIFIENCDFGKLEFALVAYAGSFLILINNVGSATYGYYPNASVIFVLGTAPINSSSGSGWIIPSGTITPTNSIFQPPAYTPPTTTPTVFKSVFTSATFDTLQYGTSNVDSYYGATAAQNRWDSTMGWKQGRIRMGPEVYNFYNGGSAITVKVRLRRKNTSHGNSGAVMPAGIGTFTTGALRGGWTSWATVSSSLFGSGGADLRLYNGVSGSSGYAIWDAIEVEVTVTKNV